MYGRDLVAQLTDHALLADDYAYQAMLDFKDKSNTMNWRTFDRALEHGLDALDDPTPGMVALSTSSTASRTGSISTSSTAARSPSGVPEPSFSRCSPGAPSAAASRCTAPPGRSCSPDVSGTRTRWEPGSSSFRYVVGAYTPGGMQRFGEGFRLTAKVRMIHAAVRHSLSRSDHWDWAGWGIPINNLDSMVTQAGQFGVKFTDAVQSSGIKFSDREIEDIFALSRYVGYVIGVPEEILHTDYDDARTKTDLHTLLELPPDDLCRDVVESILKFSIEHPPGDVEVLPRRSRR